MAKLHSASPREITSPFTREIISVLHSKACKITYTYSVHGLVIFFPSRHARSVVKSIFHYNNIKRILRIE